ncbi:MAG: prepilin-type N-terminal cleavage/methylation domain-containing protein [candidate division NC10 bacterium]|nr:prepilin-type N-terminal cleavage/methylation domain-containing protein [candidate division NC10 bacterium]
MGRRGFTTLEVILVVVAIGIIAAAGIPTLLGTIQRYRTRTGADQMVGEFRRVQSLAMISGARHRVFLRDCPSGPTPCKEYRIERESASAWPGASDGTGNNANVLTEWVDLQREYGGVRVRSLKDAGGVDASDVIFDSRGASVNAGVSYPLSLTVANAAGDERTIQVRSAGGVKLQ